MSAEGEQNVNYDEVLTSLLPGVPREHWDKAVKRTVLNMRLSMWRGVVNNRYPNVVFESNVQRELDKVEGEIADWDSQYRKLGLQIPNLRLSLFDPETEREVPFP